PRFHSFRIKIYNQGGETHPPTTGTQTNVMDPPSHPICGILALFGQLFYRLALVSDAKVTAGNRVPAASVFVAAWESELHHVYVTRFPHRYVRFTWWQPYRG